MQSTNSTIILVCTNFVHAKYWVGFFPSVTKFYVDFQSNSWESSFYRNISGHLKTALLIQNREPLDEEAFLLGSELRSAVNSLEKVGDVVLLPPPNYARASSNPKTYLRVLNAKVILK